MAGLIALGILVIPDLTTVTRDTNGDGKIDEWTHFNIWGQIVLFERDKNHDGKPEIYEYYKNGKIDLLRADYDNDGYFEATGFYKDGKLSVFVRDKNKDGKYDRVSYYDASSETPWLVLVDDNYDGVWDRRKYRDTSWEALTPDAKFLTNGDAPEKDISDKSKTKSAK